MPNLILVMLGGALGAGARHLAGAAQLRWLGPGFPWATLFVNLAGSLLMGLLAGWLVLRGGSEQTRLFLAVGILGGFTTFSAFAYARCVPLQLVRSRNIWNIAATWCV